MMIYVSVTTFLPSHLLCVQNRQQNQSFHNPKASLNQMDQTNNVKDPLVYGIPIRSGKDKLG